MPKHDLPTPVTKEGAFLAAILEELEAQREDVAALRRHVAAIRRLLGDDREAVAEDDGPVELREPETPEPPPTPPPESDPSVEVSDGDVPGKSLLDRITRR